MFYVFGISWLMEWKPEDWAAALHFPYPCHKPELSKWLKAHTLIQFFLWLVIWFSLSLQTQTKYFTQSTANVISMHVNIWRINNLYTLDDEIWSVVFIIYYYYCFFILIWSIYSVNTLQYLKTYMRWVK